MAITKIEVPELFDFGSDNSAFKLPTGTTAERPTSPSNGEMRFNTTTGFVEYYDTTDVQWWEIDYVTVPLNVDYLVVAGGGGGGRGNGGGGGAGGLLTSSLTMVLGTSYSITIGGAGAGGGGVGGGSPGSDGTNSVFSAFTSIGGGGGAQAYTIGRAGGSAGGNGLLYGLTVTSGTVGQGNAGGAANYGVFSSNLRPSGGGGGAGGAGGDAQASYISGDGGVGLQSSIIGSSTYYAGGGGGGAGSGYAGGAGGAGGGGTGANGGSGNTTGTANLGGGGGGGGFTSGVAWYDGSAGGSGVVILRMPSTSYTGTTTGSPSVDNTTVSGTTILTFTGSGTYTA